MTVNVSIRNNMTSADEADLLGLTNDLLTTSGGIVNTGDMAVSPSSGLTVSIAAGVMYIYISSLTSLYRVVNTGAVSVTHASNSSGSTRIDIICVKFDPAATPDPTASNVASLLIVQGTPGAGVPATPANHYKLAEVTVINGAASIGGGDITDRRLLTALNTNLRIAGSIICNVIEPITTTGGTSTVYTLTPTTALTAYTAGLRVPVKFHVASGATPTINISGLGAKTITKVDGSAIAASDIAINGQYVLRYDGTNFVIDGLGSGSALTVATAAEVATGTDNTKYTTPLAVAPYASQSIYRQAVIDGGCEVAQKTTTVNLSTSYQYGQVDLMQAKGTGTAVSAGTITQTTSANAGTTGYALKLSGVTITGTGVVYARHLIEAANARKFKNKTASFAVKVYHDVGSAINYTVAIGKASATDNFTTVTSISSSSAQSVANTTATTVKFENVSLGDCSTGLAIEIQGACGAVTTKNFEFTEFQMNEGTVALPFVIQDLATELQKVQRYVEKSYNYATNVGSSEDGSWIYNVTSDNTTTKPFLVSAMFKVRKRVAPTFTTYDYTGNSAKISTYNTSLSRTDNVSAAASVASEGTFRVYYNGTIAGLGYHYFADARLT